MMCPPGSRDGEFLKGLGAVSGQALPRQRPRAHAEGGFRLDALHDAAAVAPRSGGTSRAMSIDFLADRSGWLTGFIAAEWAIRIVMLIVVPFRRSPDAAKGWLLLILFEPVVGLALYLVFGRRRLPAWRLERAAAFGEIARPIQARLARHPNVFHPDAGSLRSRPRVRLAEKLGDLPILGGNAVDVLVRLRRDRRPARRRHRRRARARPPALLHHRRRRGRGTASSPRWSARRRAASPAACSATRWARAASASTRCCRGCAPPASRRRRRCASPSSGGAARAWTCATTARSR